jgi:phosphoribosyl 1,2-cyclic phosphodiesterase
MLKCVGLSSSSSGNCYLLTQNNEDYLMIEAGITISTIKKKINILGIGMNQIKGAILSHSHMDHFKSAKDLLVYMPVYSTKETLDTLGIVDVNLIPIEVGKMFNAGAGFNVVAFPTLHNAPNPVGYILKNEIGEYTLFATDTSDLKLNLPNIRFSLILIEANFDEKVMKRQLKESEKVIKRDRGYETVMKQRQLGDVGGHLSVQKAIKILKGFKLGLCKYIILIHLSPTNSFDYFADMVSKAFDNKIPVKQLPQFETEITIIENKKEGIKLDF